MALLPFIAKLILSCGLLYGYYHLFLRNKRFHHYNRFYLLIVALFSLVIPFINIPVNLFWGSGQHPALIRTLKVINANGWEEPVTIYARQNHWSKWLNIQSRLYFIYIAGAVTGFIILLRSIAWIKYLKKRYPHEVIDQLKIYNTTEPGTPFSFFRSIFWDKKISLEDKKGQQIFRHEMFHVKENHSSDVLLMEILCCIGWFNPFFHLIKKEIKAIHEFLADEYAASSDNRYDYAALLVSHAITQKRLNLTNPFFHNQIKRRITMITQSNLIRRSGYISRIMALPLLFLLVSAFAVKLTHQPPVSATSHYAAKKITVVIDPGHGGLYAGAHDSNGIMEKDIDLNIAQKIKKLAAEYNVNIVLTRNRDELVGNAATLKEDLENRVAIKNETNPDLFVSIHVNATPEISTARTGFEAYITRKKEDNKARLLSSAILNELKNIYAVDETIKQREVGIYVLDHSNCPAVIIQCGYITNPKDVAFIINPANQEKVARKILEGIVKYQLQNSQAKETTQTENRIIADTALISGAGANEKLMSAAKNQLEQAVAESKNGKTFSAVDKNNIPVVYREELDGVKQSNPTFTKVETEADYPGGQAAWTAYLIKAVHYPGEALKKKLQGTVVVQFIVDTAGKISDVKAISGPEAFRAESIRVIKESGTWTSALQNGKKVKAYKRQPITYKLSAG